MLRRQETSNEDSYLSAGRPSNLLRTSFSSAKLETLYRASSLQQRRGGLEYFLLSAFLFGANALFTPGQELPARGLTAVFLGLNLGFLAWAKHNPRAKDALWSLVPHMVWQLSTAHLLAQLFLKSTEVTPRDGLGWLLLMLYLLFATLPLRLSICVLLACSTATVYVMSVVGLSKAPAQIPVDVLVRVPRRRCNSPILLLRGTSLERTRVRDVYRIVRKMAAGIKAHFFTILNDRTFLRYFTLSRAFDLERIRPDWKQLLPRTEIPARLICRDQAAAFFYVRFSIDRYATIYEDAVSSGRASNDPLFPQRFPHARALALFSIPTPMRWNVEWSPECATRSLFLKIRRAHVLSEGSLRVCRNSNFK